MRPYTLTTQKTKMSLEFYQKKLMKLHINDKDQQSSPLDARNHYPQIKHHTPPPKIGATTNSLYPRFPTLGTKR